jgi:hypothetical protein
MPFNLKKEKQKRRPIDVLREKCPDLRHSDLDLKDEEVEYLASVMGGEVTKVAVHGRGDNWTEVGPEYNPYRTSPLVNAVPEFGGRWRRNFPGSGDQHINDDSDKQKNLKGTATDEDFDPVLKSKKINDRLEGKGACLVRMELSPDQDATEELAKRLLGDEGRCDGRSIYVMVDNFEDALQVQRDQRAKGLRVFIEQTGE